ncbi:hypothetical protein AWZ03_000656 [Drosophila navojoa]|uniref:Uncharacterized protein n=1 Tax=Drosophila navojoa TaxID=7232 RepID=A0A484BWN6_DRONA|nr:hypothetical protein AWZ03_000656 [Drosophila navojoa]
MFELRLQFYQRNDISLKALKGLPMPMGREVVSFSPVLVDQLRWRAANCLDQQQKQQWQQQWQQQQQQQQRQRQSNTRTLSVRRYSQL